MSAEIVMISDQSRARIFMRTSNHDAFTEVSDFINTTENLSENQIASDRQGMPSGPMQIQGHFISAEENIYRHGWEVFAQTLVHTLDEYIDAQPNSNLYVVAPPRFLGVIRKKLTDNVKKHIVKEINHNLTMMRSAVLTSMLPDYIKRPTKH